MSEVENSGTRSSKFIESIVDNNFDRFYQLLSDPTFDPAYGDNTPFLCACVHGRTNMVDAMIRIGRVDPANDPGNYARRSCITKGFTDIVKIIDSYQGIPTIVNPQDNILIESIIRNNIQIFETILNHPGFDPTFCKNMAIMCASIHNRIEMVDLILKTKKINPSDLESAKLTAKIKMFPEIMHLLDNYQI